MKKAIFLILLIGVLVCLLCVSALAADIPTVAGIYNITGMPEGISITALDADGAAITASDARIDGADYSDFYGNAVKLRVSYSNAVSGKFYLVLAMNDETSLPTADNIVYIDQATGTTSVEFVVYPSDMDKGEYYIYLSSNSGTGLTEVCKFSYFVPYTLGDVNDDGAIDSEDALLVLKHFVGIITLDETHKLAANVNGDSAIDSEDALLILKYFVGIISSF